jgi:hypothetical protein
MCGRDGQEYSNIFLSSLLPLAVIIASLIRTLPPALDKPLCA